jgi:hypothetical protein
MEHDGGKELQQASPIDGIEGCCQSGVVEMVSLQVLAEEDVPGYLLQPTGNRIERVVAWEDRQDHSEDTLAVCDGMLRVRGTKIIDGLDELQLMTKGCCQRQVVQSVHVAGFPYAQFRLHPSSPLDSSSFRETLAHSPKIENSPSP